MGQDIAGACGQLSLNHPIEQKQSVTVKDIEDLVWEWFCFAKHANDVLDTCNSIIPLVPYFSHENTIIILLYVLAFKFLTTVLQF